MEFSLFNLMTLPNDGAKTGPKNGPSQADVYAQMRAMTQMADGGGFDIAWFAEHHLSNYSICPSPLMACSHMAALTKHIRVGPAVIVLPFYEPLRLAEDICMTDQLCGGRLVLGFGTGYQPREFKKFGFEINDRMQRGLEVWDVIHQALTTGRIDYAGKHIEIGDAALSIRPVQSEIRTFAVGNAPQMRQRIIERGAIPMTTPAVGPAELIATARRLYAETRVENGLSDDKFPFAVQRYVYVAEDQQDAVMAAEQILIHARMATNMRQAEPSIDGAMLNIVPFEGEPSIDEILERAIIGDAQAVADRILKEADEFGMTHLSAFMQFAGLPFDKALASLDRFCEHVMPMVKANTQA